MTANTTASGIYRRSRWPLALAMGFAIATGCQAQSTQEGLGTLLGAGLGGLFGSQVGSGSGRTAAIIGGVVLGGIVGRTIGRHMDENDRRRTAEVLDSTPTGETVAWRNPDSGNDFKMTPVRDYQSEQGQPCRDFVQEVIVDGERKQVGGSACKESDGGSWTSS